MKKKQGNDLNELLKNASMGATHIISSPEAIKKLQSQGIPIKERFITYEEYFENLMNEKRKNAVELLKHLPLLDPKIANSVIAAIYEEIRASFGLGIFTSAIFNSILLLEYATRVRVHNERLKSDPNALWENVEKLKMKGLIKQLGLMKIINKSERGMLDSFNDDFRNPYLHINIHKMIKGIYANNVKVVDTKNNKVNVKNDLDISKYRQLWFLAKKFYDKSYIEYVLKFCIGWTNQLLVKAD